MPTTDSSASPDQTASPTACGYNDAEQPLFQSAQGFKNSNIAPITVDGGELNRWAWTTLAYLQHPKQYLTPSTAPETTRLLERVEMESPLVSVSAAQLDDIRRVLKGIQVKGNHSDPTAATIALTRLDGVTGSTPEAELRLWYACSKQLSQVAVTRHRS